MLVKMSVVRNEIITVNTETGEISGKTYNAKDWIKRNFDPKWDKEKKVWVADIKVIEKELENTRYYGKYIVSVSDEKDAGSNEPNDEVIEEKLVNGYDGFYVVKTWKSGKKTRHFVG